MISNTLMAIRSMLGDEMIRDVAIALGESRTGFDKALRTGIPALLAGAIEKISTSNGAAELFRFVSGPDVDGDFRHRIQMASDDDFALNDVLSDGESMLRRAFGERVHQVTGAISDVTGATSSATAKALQIAVLVLFGALKQQVTQGRLNATDFAALLAEQRDAVLQTGFHRRVAAAVGWKAENRGRAPLAEHRSKNYWSRA